MNIFASVKEFGLHTWQWFLARSLLQKIIIGVVVIAAIFFGFKTFGGKKQNIQYQTATAEKGTLVISVSGSGQVSAANSVAVSTEVSGVVQDVYVKNGDYVEAGQAIAEVTLDQNSQQKQAQAYAAYVNAQSTTQTAQQNKLSMQADLEAKRKAVLDAQNAVDYMHNNTTNPSTKQAYTELEKESLESALTNAHEAFTAAEKKYLEADTSIGAGSASQTSAWLSYEQTLPTIKAPISGVVADLTLQPGTVIASQGSSSQSSSASSSGSNTSQQVATVKTDGNPTVTINLSEIDIPKVEVGNRATLTFDAFPGKTLTGKVVGINTTGSVSSGVTTYPVTIVLDSAPFKIYANMSVSANIITATKSDVLLVPSSAIQTQNGQSTVRVMKGKQVQFVPVEVGDASDTDTEIVSGISEGDTVVTGVITTGTPQRTGGTASPFGAGGFGGARGGGNFIRVNR